ncbi:MAG: MFS transporter [Parvularculaceae bacterium]
MSLAPSTSVFRHRAYAYYWVMRQCVSSARQMQAVAIGWQIYDLARLTRSIEESAFILGLVGLAQFLPVLLLSLVGGQAADRLDRKMILIVSNLARAVGGLGLIATVFLPHQIAIPSIFGIAILPAWRSERFYASGEQFPLSAACAARVSSAIAWNSLGFQGAAIAGPALGGLLYALGAQVVYGVSVTLTLLAVLSISLAKTPKHQPVAGRNGLAMAIEELALCPR